jgi:hypothetical protein
VCDWEILEYIETESWGWSGTVKEKRDEKAFFFGCATKHEVGSKIRGARDPDKWYGWGEVACMHAVF